MVKVQYPASTIKDENDAAARYKKTCSKDPFPGIPPALLNSADIHEYIEATGMIYPYDSSLVKSSSYEVQIGGKAIYWDGNGKKHIIDLEKGEEVKLEPNSLVYFQTKQKFRLPDYIAIRFNLRITNVHRGLLLGTGPLVDPGFEGHLLIPLHNLTNNSYIFRTKERFVWVEFTKISPNEKWLENEKGKHTRSVKYRPFPDDKKNIPASDYLIEANPNGYIGNAIPAALEKVKNLVISANTKTNVITIGGFLAIIFGIVSFYPIFNDFSDLAMTATNSVAEMKSDISSHLSSNHNQTSEEITLQEQLAETNERLEESKTQGDALAENVRSLDIQVARLQEQIAQLLENQASQKK